MKRMRPCDYDDGYDDEPPPPEVYFSEDVGPQSFAPIALGDAVVPVVELCATAYCLAPQCESPIEIELGAALIEKIKGTAWQVIPQYKWQRFRIDFAIAPADGGDPILFIECDGKQFHSTPEQIQRDRRKDAAAKAADIPLLRFTGAEIFHNAKWIARLVQDRLGGEA